jgi:outer membrane receptor protein involved in Fe transport
MLQIKGQVASITTVSTDSQRTSALSLAVAAAIAAMGSGQVMAQQGPAAGDEASSTEVVVATGTRVRRTDGMAEPTPVTTLTPDELSLFEPGSTVAEQLDALPQFFNTGTAQRGGPSFFGDGGGSYLDMRGLGRDRTLVLFDGLRVPPADKRGQVNVDTLPNALVSSVDIVTGGASAAYGADALGGVTNFVLDRQFEGMKLSATTGMNEFNSDGSNWKVSLAGGTDFGDRINLVGSIETRHIDQINRLPTELDPSWYQRWGHVTNPDWDAADPPGTNPQRITVPWVASPNQHVNGVIRPSPFGVLGPSALANMRFTDDGSALVPFDFGDLSDTSTIVGGSDALIAHQTTPGGPNGYEVDQTNAFVSLVFDVTDSVSFFSDLLIGKVETKNQSIFEGASLSGPWSPTVFRENAYLPDSVAAIMDAEGRSSFRLQKGGNYPGVLDIDNNGRSVNEFDTEMLRVGVDWNIDGNWQMRFSMQSGETTKLTAEYGSLRVDRSNLAFDAVEVYNDMRDVDLDGITDLVADADRGTGTIVCNVQRYNPTPAELAAHPAIQGRTSSRDPNLPLASPIGLDNTISDCVPLNIMGNGISQAAADYIMTPKWGDSVVEQDFAEVLVTGEIADGWGAGPVSLATGVTYRDQSFTDSAFPIDVDALGPPVNAPDLGIRGIASTWQGGSPNLHQFSTVSLLSGQYDVWEAFGEVNLPIWLSDSGNRRLGTSFAFRSSDYSSVGRVEAWKYGMDFQLARDIRLRTTRSRDVREATFSERFDNSPGGGFVSEDYETNTTNVLVTATSAGNPNLRPEVADTTVYGFVYTPQWADGLRMSIDRYEVDIADSIATLSVSDVVRECYFNNVLCDNIFRDTNGILSRVLAPYLNLDQAYVQGIDYEIDYSRDVNWTGAADESFSLRFLGGQLEHRTNTVTGSVPDEFAGGQGFPELTANVTATYRFGPWSVQLQERYIDSVLLNRTWIQGVDVDDNTVQSKAWTNFVLRYGREVPTGGRWSLAFNVQNIFDVDPPVIPGGAFGQATSNTYDVFGRRYQMTFNYDL